jgi:hypothetical protein
VHLDDVAHDSEPKTQPAMFASRRTIGLTESVENIRKKFRLNADSIIRNRDLRVLITVIEFHDHETTIGREFHCIGQQVPHRLLKTSSVP